MDEGLLSAADFDWPCGSVGYLARFCAARTDEAKGRGDVFDLGDFARNVGSDRVEVTTLVRPNGDVHVYTPPNT